ncbi:hypothetical protein LTR56_015353 [Elasticomyces elasticus]|nr:hypothetical protein LTR56_015353 [Elasticomyces elasticus]KAK3637522.1 hypothetical protein LTR22_018245 [Elasticomyces elasticus]KAK4905376.1 hypothetical protein LTR49_025325 [Elasticomyces elasticus]KAK5746115.1 hypothetical protein LTS12_022828 [Elasticomyces elasticus]
MCASLKALYPNYPMPTFWHRLRTSNKKSVIKTRNSPRHIMANSKCYLLNLPAELRNDFWNLALQPFLLDIVVSSPFKCLRELRAGPPPLSQVNQDIRTETLPMYYGQATFYLDFRSDFEDQNPGFRGWLSSIGDDAVKQLRHLHVEWASTWSVMHELTVHITPRGNAEGKYVAWDEIACTCDGSGVFDEYDYTTPEDQKGRAEVQAQAQKAYLEVEVRGMLEKSVDGSFSAEDWEELIHVFGGMEMEFPREAEIERVREEIVAELQEEGGKGLLEMASE